MDGSSRAAQIADNLERIKARIGSTRLVAVTKAVDIADIRMLADAGHFVFGESKVKDAGPRVAEVPGEWHMIGHLQTNKVAEAVRIFDWIDSVDSERLAARISHAAVSQQKMMDVLIQVNIGEEKQKHGVMKDHLFLMLQQVCRLPNICIRGLMAIAPLGTPEEARPYFQEMKRLFGAARAKHDQMDTLSMGMTNDYEVAVQEGATQVRIGTALWR